MKREDEEPKEPTVHGPSQQNITVDPKFERVKREIKAEILPKERLKQKPRRTGSVSFNDFV